MSKQPHKAARENAVEGYGSNQPKISRASIVRAIAKPKSSPKEVLSLFAAAVRQHGFCFDLSTYVSLIPFLVVHRRLRAAELLLRRLPLAGIYPGPSLLLPLTSSALSCGIPSDYTAQLLLSASPSASAFSSLLRYVLHYGQLCLARSLLLSADPGDLGFTLKTRHFAGFVRELCRTGNIEKAKEMVVLMGKKGAVADVETYNALLAAVCEHRGPFEGFCIYRSMLDLGISPDVITFSILMGRLGMEGRVSECNALFGRMLINGVFPDWACYRILFGVYCRNWLLASGLMVLRAMKIDGFLDDVGIEWSVMACGMGFEEVVLCYVLKRGIIGVFWRN
ncbi:hypothetical protein HPP92_011394 [Vanilla planifolia]|nr:hypothetical protein HPP92_011394 [Vanilla planifolia]